MSSNNDFEEKYTNSHLLGNNAGYLEEIYEPNSSVSASLSHIQFGGKVIQSNTESAVQWANAYRQYGHMASSANPFKGEDARWDIDICQTLSCGTYNLDANQQLEMFWGGNSLTATVQQWQVLLNNRYCGDIAYEFMHMTISEERQYLQNVIELDEQVTDDELWQAWQYCYQAEAFEQNLGILFPSQKRFSLEGLEPYIALVNQLIMSCATDGCSDIVIGMAHRGRLNTLVNTLGVSVDEVIDWFKGGHGHDKTSGDVKYHLGYSCDRLFSGRQVHINLAYNPSHLEAVNSVVMGAIRARIDASKSNARLFLPILVHGDASFSGQGVVQECLNMSYTEAYNVGGTIHIVLNNNIGFTTGFLDSRSSRYCSDVMKIIEAPVIHVNAYNIDAVIKAAKIASNYRQHFGKDICIVLNGYRKHGHNEADEPRFTQPGLYRKIAEKSSLLVQIEADLLAVFSQKEIDAQKEVVNRAIQQRHRLIDIVETAQSSRYLSWQEYKNISWRMSYDNSITGRNLKKIGKYALTLHAEASGKSYQSNDLHPLIQKLYERRQLMLKGQEPIDWGMAEIMAYNVILSHDRPVRIVGEDCVRGTFSHRHACLVTHNDDQIYLLKQPGAHAAIFNSTLSEYAALGYEYGYSEARPQGLTVWEAQFGDFVNGGQIIIDQFISSAWQKWSRRSGLVLLMPHGYEGQGPEHSSARLERILQLCAQENIQVCLPSTPAQMYHVLLRQVLRQVRMPLFIFTPKSLLRHHECKSHFDELANGSFQLVIDDSDVQNDSKRVSAVILCSAKVYYDLCSLKESHKDIAICRIEQLYPFPKEELMILLKKYTRATKIIWVQEEPFNQGAWLIKRHNFEECVQQGQTLHCVCRSASSSPAIGYYKRHLVEQENLLKQVKQIICEVEL